jgi:glucose-1-phosphate cytidylyltransferase
MSRNVMEVHQRNTEPWRITLVDTGENTLTGGRLKRVGAYLEDEECFCFTYGDGLSNVDISETIRLHRAHGKLATVTAVRPPGRYGALKLDGSSVTGFTEKPRGESGWINGGFFVLSPKVLDLISGDAISWEGDPLKKLASTGELAAYKHKDFWQPMDTLREKIQLEDLWQSGKAPWKVWDRG